uniref:Uncharacterized protein n=1 Tax=Rhizophora mucronata TaxID=61149 RepID=A0A2P2JID6_RHIMU
MDMTFIFTYLHVCSHINIQTLIIHPHIINIHRHDCMYVCVCSS